MQINELYTLDESDPATWEFLALGKTCGIFQCESQLGSDACKQVKPKNVDDLANITAVIRPGTLNYKFHDGKSATNHFYMRCNKEEEDVYEPKALSSILNQTHGIFLFQEQSIKAAKELSGFSPAEAMRLQKGISKKKADVIMELRPKFIQGCINNGLSKEDAEKIYDQIETSNRYSFNKCLYKNTMVNTRYGHAKIKRIKIGDLVVSTNHQLCKVLDVIDSGQVDCVKVWFKNGQKIICSINHKISTHQGILPLYNIIENNLSTKLGDKIIKLKMLGKRKCYDLEVNSSDHLFMANGLLVSNSHAVGYGKLSFVTAYLKAHYLKEFMVGTLRFSEEKIDTNIQIRKIVKECKGFGIDIRPPSILNPCVEFTDIGGVIYFGISNIKGIGPAQATLLIEKAVGCKTWYETLMNIRDLNKTTVINSVLCGVFSHFKLPRKKMADDFYNLSLLNGKPELAFIDQNWKNYNNLGDLVSDVFKVASKVRKEKVDSILKLINEPAETLQDNPEDITSAEYNLLGCNVSFNNIDKIDKLGNITIEEYNSGKYLKKYTLVAEIKNVKQHIIKNGTSAGRNMCFLDLVDQTGEMTGTVFAAGYNEFGGYLTVGRCLYFIGNRSNRGDFVVDAIKEIK